VADHGRGTINRGGFANAAGFGPTVSANSGPGARGTSVSQPGASAQGSAKPQVAKSQKQALDGRSPREHRANVWLQRRTVATDLSVDQSLEVERRRRKRRNEATRLRGAEGLRRGRRSNGGKARTAVARIPRPIPRFWSSRAGFTRQGGAEACGRRRRLTRNSYWQGESFEGWSATGDGPGKPTTILAAPTVAERISGTARHQGAASEPRSRKGDGKEVSEPGGFGRWRSRLGEWNGPDDLKLGEPHDRFQGATNLNSVRWSKPSESGGTTGTERARRLAASGRWCTASHGMSPRGRAGRQLLGAAEAPGVDTTRKCRWRGDL
jgi:hypothetical protein